MQGNRKLFLQVISCNPFDSATIQAYGCNRIQLVSALEIGGVTPSSTIVRKSLEAASIPTHVIVRHHNNGFVHNPQEKKLLLDQVIELKDKFNVHGVVVGSLQRHGESLLVDTLFVSDIVKECGGKTKVTFHKASDLTANLSTAVRTLTELGVDQILTQGGKQSALSASSLHAIRQIQPELRVKSILAGGGINHSNVKQILYEWETNRIHIGTCVRTNKYGPVDGQLIMAFRQTIDHLQ